MKAKSLLLSYAAARGEGRKRIGDRIRSNRKVLAGAVGWGLSTGDVRKAAVELTRGTPPEDVDESVARAAAGLLRSVDPAERGAAEDILLHLGDRAVEPLVGLLKEDEPRRARKLALGILARAGERGEDAVARHYVSFFRIPDRDLRRAARRQLEHIGQAATPRLVEALRDPMAEVRLFAAGTLGAIEDPRAVEALVAGLEPSEADLGVKMAIGDALSRITKKGGWGHDLQRWRKWWVEHRASYPPQLLPREE